MKVDHILMPKQLVETHKIGEALHDVVVARQHYHAAVAHSQRLSTTEFFCLHYLYAKGPLAHHQLADFLDITPSAITSAVETITRLQFASRVAHPSDRRVTLVDISPAGTELIDSFISRFARQLAHNNVDLAATLATLTTLTSVLASCVNELSDDLNQLSAP